MMQKETLMLHSTTIDRFNKEKLYIQLTKIFTKQIDSGRWTPGSKIPTEEALCKEYAVSRITVKQAINNLVSEGYLMKFQGKGTFVTGIVRNGCLNMRTRFTEDMFGKGVKTEKKTLSCQIKSPPQDAREYLKTAEDVHYLLNKRVVDGHPVYIEESFIPLGLVPDLDKLDLTRSSLYTVLQERATKKIFKVIQTVEISHARGQNARYLDVRIGVPVLVIHRLLLSSDNTPLAYTRFLGRSDRYKFQTEFERVR
jgi:GntR family transcriptional regulator